MRDPLSRKDFRLDRLNLVKCLIRYYSTLPPDSPLYDKQYGDFIPEMKLDAAKIQLIHLLSPAFLKKVLGVYDRNLREIKFQDPIVNKTLDKKLRLNVELLQKEPIWRRKRFEKQLFELLDMTVLHIDVARIIVKFAIMD